LIAILAAVAANGVIGRDGGLPWHLPEDLRLFKQRTYGHALVMGRRTYESIGRPLPGRTTVVVTRRPDWSADGVLVAHDIAAALALAGSAADEVYVVGGAEVFADTLPIADVLLVTWVDGEFEGDTWFPPVDWSQWREIERTGGDGFTLVEYRRA
jgi:dihydrofolate reductase